MTPELDRPARAIPTPKDSIPYRLEMDIIFGRIGPGTRLIEDELMARFDISRHRARTAIDTLAKRGLAKRETNKGAHVCGYTLAQIHQMYELRTILQDAAIRSIDFPVDPKVITALIILNEAHATAIKRGDLEEVFHINEQFHRTMFGCCKNKELRAVIEAQARRTHPIRTNSFKISGYLALAHKEHQDIIEALIAGDARQLVLLCRAHIQRPMADYIAQYQPVSSD